MSLGNDIYFVSLTHDTTKMEFLAAQAAAQAPRLATTLGTQAAKYIASSFYEVLTKPRKKSLRGYQPKRLTESTSNDTSAKPSTKDTTSNPMPSRIASVRFSKRKRYTRSKTPAKRRTKRRKVSGLVRGRGDYMITSGLHPGNTLENQLVQGSGVHPLHFKSSGGLSGDVIICHREFVQNITAPTPPSGNGSSLFDITLFEINPGIRDTFPWLSQIATNFTLYEFDGLVFEYIPTSGEFGTSLSNALGKVVMATNYDADAPKFTSTVVMENYDYAVAGKPSLHLLHGVECKKGQRLSNQLYTRAGDTTKDKVLTDLGTFQLATEGIQIAGTPGDRINVGELWVTYKIKLSRAQLFTSIGDSNIWGYASHDSGEAQLNSLVLTAMLPNPYSTLKMISSISGTTPTNGFITSYLPETVTSGYYQIIVTRHCINGDDFTWEDNLINTQGIEYGWRMFTDDAMQDLRTPPRYAPPNPPSGADFPDLGYVAPTGLTAQESKDSIAIFFIKVNSPGNAHAGFTIRGNTSFVATDSFALSILQVPNTFVEF